MVICTFYLREQLCIVVLVIRVDVGLAIIEEFAHRLLGVFGDRELVSVRPDLDANQRQVDVQGFVELKRENEFKRVTSILNGPIVDVQGFVELTK